MQVAHENNQLTFDALISILKRRDKQNQMIDNSSIFCIVVTYNAEKWIEKCLSSIIHYPVIVIDNNSADKTTEIIKSKFHSVELVESDKNLGFGKANNIGIRMAIEKNAQYFFLLNQDAWVEPTTVKVLAEEIQKNPDFGVLSPMQYFDENVLDRKFKSYIRNRNIENRESVDKKEIVPVNFVNAAVWMVSRKCIETVGLFSPVFSHYGEDQNFCHRCKFHNLKIGVSPHVRAFHEREQTPRKESDVKKMLARDMIYCYAILLNLKHSLFRQWLFLFFVSFKNCILTILQLRFKNVFVLLARTKMIFCINDITSTREVTKRPGAYLNRH